MAKLKMAKSTLLEKRYPAIAIIEFNSIAAGITAGDAMVKKAPLELVKTGTVHPGKYLVMVGGEVAAVDESYREGLRTRSEAIVDHVILPHIHQEVHDAVLGRKIANDFEALGVIETSTVAANVEAADAGVKGAEVEVLEIRLADDLGGNSFTLFGGKVEDVEAAIRIGKERIADKDIKINTTVIPNIDKLMIKELDSSSYFHNSAKKAKE
jgi:microcompartment protein CcmL/EutN